MRSRLLTRCAAAAIVAACLVPASPAFAQGFKWWNDEAVQKRLVLSADQRRRLDEIFVQALPALRSSMRRLESAEHDLTALIERSTEEDGPVVRQLELVESVRAELNKSRTLMLLHLRRVLSPDQRQRLDELHRERDRIFRKPDRRSSH